MGCNEDVIGSRRRDEGVCNEMKDFAYKERYCVVATFETPKNVVDNVEREVEFISNQL